MLSVFVLASATHGVWLGDGAAQAAPAANGPVCEFVEAGFVDIDGLLDDWRGISGHRTTAAMRDGTLTIRCAYDNRRVYLAIDVRDQDVVRTRGRGGSRGARKQGEDRLTVRLGLGSAAEAVLEAWPGVDAFDPARTWKGQTISGDSAAIDVEDSLQKHGWSLELAMPMSELSGLSMGVPGLRARIGYHDADQGGKKRDLSFSGALTFRASAEAFRALLKAVKLSPGDVRLDVVGEFNDAPGVERVIAGGTTLAVVTDSYAYMTLPAASAADVLRVEAVDLRGDGTLSILTLLRQRGNGGMRELLVVWGLGGRGRFERILAVEVGKQFGSRTLRNRWSLQPKPSSDKRAVGQDILIEVADSDVVGWSRETYVETPATDVRPILTPWSQETALLFSFEGSSVIVDSPPAPAPRRKPRRR